MSQYSQGGKCERNLANSHSKESMDSADFLQRQDFYKEEKDNKNKMRRPMIAASAECFAKPGSI
jgi:hypothetical protein